LLLVAWLGVRRQLTRVAAKQWARQGLAGVLLFVGCHGTLAWVEQRISSGTAALYLATVPLWLVIGDAVQRRRVPPARVLGGLCLGVLGVWTLSRRAGSFTGAPADELMLVGSACSWAVGSMVGKQTREPGSIAQATAMQLTVGALALLAVGAAIGEFDAWNLHAISARGALALAFLVSSLVLAFCAYNWLLRVTTPAAAGSYAFVNPVLAVLLGAAVGDEQLTPRMAAAGALVLAALVLTQSRG
jgi:drug/metabolite transporter (DMT)-like permease